MITIIDYGMGNLRSVQKALERIGVNAVISCDPDVILSSRKLILPGVGHFRHGMENLRSKNLIEILNEAILEKNISILGICLGMQLMTLHSEEGNISGLGWMKAVTKKFNFSGSPNFKIPHIGWNNLIIGSGGSLYKNISEKDFFYFVHSYYVELSEKESVITETSYGNRFISSFQFSHIFGCQFHPEKSHDSGLKFLKNFIDY